MKEHSVNFKDNMSKMGRQVDSVITYDTTTLHDELYGVDLVYKGALLKSVMKELDIESSVDIPKGTILNYRMGIKGGFNKAELEAELDHTIGETFDVAYEYLDFGNYIVYSSERQEDEMNYKIVCYDKMLYSMIDYEPLNITYPITIKNYISAICGKLGLTFANANDTFPNYNRQIMDELYLDIDNNSIGYTFRDVLDELAQVTASTICINGNDELEIRYISEIPERDNIDEVQLKDVNVDFGEKFGPVNSIVLSRAESDNVYLQDTESIEENGLCEIKIVDNQIMNGNDRSDYLEDILEQLDGLEYYINDYSSTGICYLELCDKYKVTAHDNEYDCIMFNDEINIGLGIEENINTEMPEQAETDYTKADKTDRRINQTTLIVDKHNQEIQTMITQIGDREGKTTSITQDIDHIESLVEDTIDLTDEVNGIDPITLENCREGNLLELRIRGNNTVFKPLVPTNSLVPSNTLVPLSSKLKVTHLNDEEYEGETTYDIYDLDIETELKQSGQYYDEFVVKEGYAYELRRIGSGGTIIENPEPTNKRPFVIPLTRGTNIIEILSYEAQVYARWVVFNEVTNYFATGVDLQSSIEQSSSEIKLSVMEEVTDDFLAKRTIESSIDLGVLEDEGYIKMKTNKLTIDSDYFKLLADGEIQTTKGQIGGWYLDDRDFYKDTTISGDIVRAGMYATTALRGPFFYAGATPGESLYNANFYVTHSGEVKTKWIDMDAEDGWVHIAYASGRTALDLGYNFIHFKIDDQANNYFGGLNRSNNGFDFDLLSGLTFTFYDYLHNISLLTIYRQDDQGNAAHINIWQKAIYFGGTGTGYEVATKNDICDERVKKNIVDSKKSALDKVKQIKFKEFDWNEKEIDRSGHIDIGITAQQIKDIDENFVETTTISTIVEDKRKGKKAKNGKEDTQPQLEQKEVYSINVLNVVTTALKAIQELNNKVEEQQKEIDDLKSRIEKLEKGEK